MPVTDAIRPPAEVYDARFVPALFAPWAETVCAAAALRPGQTVLDVGCGTGALTLAAARATGDDACVTGLDPNPEMLAVARAKPTGIAWRQGRAEDLPFADASFDATVSQFAMMFFDDPARALAEMLRVSRPGGRVAVAVCADIAASPGYAAFAALLDRLFGRAVGDAFRAPFILGDAATLKDIAAAAGVTDARVASHHGQVRFGSIADMVSTERACAWTLGGVLDDDQFGALLREAETALAAFAGPDGAVRFEMPALILTCRR